MKNQPDFLLVKIPFRKHSVALILRVDSREQYSDV